MAGDDLRERSSRPTEGGAGSGTPRGSAAWGEGARAPSQRDAFLTLDLPLPAPSQDNAEFYAAAARGELRFQRCTPCRRFRHYPRPACPYCLSREFSWEQSTGRGTVHTWTIVRGPTLPAFQDKLPYNVVDVLLDEGVHFVSEVLDCPPDEIRAGMPVEATFVAVSDDITLVKFRRCA